MSYRLWKTYSSAVPHIEGLLTNLAPASVCRLFATPAHLTAFLLAKPKFTVWLYLVLLLVQKQGRFEVYEGDAQPPMSPPVGPGQQFMDQNLGSKPTTPEHGA